MTNLVGILGLTARRLDDKWYPLLGVGTRSPISARSLPQPDFMVKGKPATDSQISEEALAIVEVLSESNTEVDRFWRWKVYASVRDCQHYVTVSAEQVEVVAYDRARDWQARIARSLADSLELPALGVGMSLAEVYRSTKYADARS